MFARMTNVKSPDPISRLRIFTIVVASIMAACSSGGGASDDRPQESGPPVGSAESVVGTDSDPSVSTGVESSGASPSSTPPPPAGAVTGIVGSIVDGAFTATFDGTPEQPAAWKPTNWDVTVHSRDRETMDVLEPMSAHHGTACGGPPETHEMTAYAQATFQCRDHMMTAISAAGYGVIYLTPDALVDFSDEEAVISFDISTARNSRRDWWDIWISPYDTSLQLPLDATLPDLSGPPEDAVLVGLGADNDLSAQIFENFEPVQFPEYPEDRVPGKWGVAYDTFLTPDASRRDTVEIRISRNHLKVGMPQHDFWWIDTDIPELGWSQGVVQLGHHSYNPAKDCGSGNIPGADGECSATTWHWDNLKIAPAVPFTIVQSDRREAKEGQATITFSAPAPADAHLRFAGIGDQIEISADGGATWTVAEQQVHGKETADESFGSYWLPIAPGTTQVQFRGTDWWGGAWIARDITIWSPSVPSGGSASP